MARPRKHDQQDVLDAVERVIARDGVLTVDAVAREAGVSKAVVLYDYTSKRELLAALVERTIAADNQFNEDCSAPFKERADATLLGRIEAARRSPVLPDGNPAVLSLIAALMQDADLRQKFRDNQASLRDRIFETATDPRSTRLAWLALEGLKFQQHMNLIDWTEDQAAEILSDIQQLALSGQALPAQRHD